MELHQLILSLRKQLGLSQRKFAEMMHVSFSTVNRWENAHVTPNQIAIVTMIGICNDNNINSAIKEGLQQRIEPERTVITGDFEHERQ